MSREKGALNLSTLVRNTPATTPEQRARVGWQRRIEVARQASLSRFQPGEGFLFSAKGTDWFFRLCDGWSQHLYALPLWQDPDQAMAWYGVEAFFIRARSQKADALDVKMNMLGYATVEAIVKAWRAVKAKGLDYAEIQGGLRLTRVGEKMVAEVLLDKEEP